MIDPSPLFSDFTELLRDTKLLMLPEREGTIGLVLSKGMISSSSAYGSRFKKGRSFDLSSDSCVWKVVVVGGALYGVGLLYICGPSCTPGVVGDLADWGDDARVNSGTFAELFDSVRRGSGRVMVAF